ncbi:MAG: hypothetical protein IPH86_13685 [bacterium]|nr:hypothetical protein [bacterium]
MRNLAGRSAEAARSTADLIEEAQRNANEGVRVNREVAEILMRINQSVSGAAGLMAEVNAASNRQSQGIVEITTAVDSMDHVIQGNAASSEEIASAGEELSAQAADLNQMVTTLVELVTGSRPQADGRLVMRSASARPAVARDAPRPAPTPTRRSPAGSNAGADVVIPLDAADEEIMI